MADPHVNAAENPDVKFEATDIPYNVVLYSLVVLLVIIILSIVSMWILFDVLKEQTARKSLLPLVAETREQREEKRREYLEKAAKARADGNDEEGQIWEDRAFALRRLPGEPWKEEYEERRKKLLEEAAEAEGKGNKREAELKRYEATALDRVRPGARLEGIKVPATPDFNNQPRSGVPGWPSLATLERPKEQDELRQAGYTDPKDKKGAYIPVDRAMELMIEKNKLKTAPTIPSKQ